MVYLPTGSSAMSYLPSEYDTASRRSWVEFSMAVMRACPISLPDGSVTVPVKALRSTCAKALDAKAISKIAEKVSTKQGENLCILASKR
jgi:hypothetical protein